MRTLGEFMTRDVKTLRADQQLLDALEFLQREKVRHIPILDGAGALVGVVTDRDVKRATPSALVPEQREVWERLVRETRLSKIMSRDPLTASSAQPLTEALRQVVENKIGCLPVTDARGALAGIVTAQDLLRVCLEVLEGR